MKLKEEIQAYQPYNKEEEKDKELILQALDTEPDIFTRKNPLCHMTASAWVVNKTVDKVLFCYHKIYQSWSWLGGHADSDEDLLAVSIKEAKEESGLINVQPFSKDIFSLECLNVSGHYKKGQYVSSHLHLNVTYLLVADENENLKIKEDENSSLQWFTFDEALKNSTEPWFIEHIYPKLIEKCKALKKAHL